MFSGDVRMWDVVDLARARGDARRLIVVVTPSTSVDAPAHPEIRSFDESIVIRYATEAQRTPLGIDADVPGVAEAIDRLRGLRSWADITVVDPWHDYHESVDVIEAAIRTVRAGGRVIVHDCGPEDEALAGDPPAAIDQAWCGETWRAFLDVVSRLPDAWSWHVIDADFGIGVVIAPSVIDDASLESALASPIRTVPPELDAVLAHRWRGTRTRAELGLVSPHEVDVAGADPWRWLRLVAAAEEPVDPAIEPSPADTDRVHRTARCPVCGHRAGFAFDGSALREGLVCRECHSISRFRRVALGVLRALDELAGVRAASLAELPGSADRSVRLLDALAPFDVPSVASYAAPTHLRRRSWMTVNGPDVAQADWVSVDLPDSSVDLVVASDVVHATTSPDRAHAEIARVLRPGGVYVFTAPHARSMVEHLPLHDHVDPTRPSAWAFGTRVDRDLERLGLTVEYANDDIPGFAIAETELFYCRKR